jgi:hypothetical protein
MSSRAYDDILREIESLGRRELEARVRRAARRALAAVPDGWDEHDGPGGKIVGRFSKLFEKGSATRRWSDDELLSYSQEVGWGVRVAQLFEQYLMNNGDTDPASCVAGCRKKYDACINDYGCDESGWICVCCIPCSLEYMGCVLGCSDPRKGLFGLGGAVIA